MAETFPKKSGFPKLHVLNSTDPLAAALGHLGNPGHKEVQAIVEGALTRIIKAGRAAGILTADETLAKRYLELGATFVAVGTDVLLLSRATTTLALRFKVNSSNPTLVINQTDIS